MREYGRYFALARCGEKARLPLTELGKLVDAPLGALDPSRSFSPPPNVPGIPFVGNLLDFKKYPREFLIDAAARCGDVFRISTPIGPVNFISGAPCRLLAQKPEEYGLHREGFFKAFETETDVDIFGVQGEHHHRLRGLLKLGYSRQITAQQTSDIAAVVQDVASEWRDHSTFDLFKIGSRIALWSSMATATPIDLRPWTDDFIRAGNTVMSIMVRALPPQAAYTPWYRLAKGRMWKILGEVVARHRAGEFASMPNMSITDALLQTVNSAGEQMDDTAARGAVAYSIVGTDIYVGRTIGFLLYEVLRDPDLYAHIRREIDTAFADGVYDPARFRRMPYLRGAYMETLRFYPLLPGIAFFASRDIEVGGFKIAKDELMFLSPQIAHFSRTFYKNPTTFDATRCMAPRNEHLQSGAHAAFGVGKRTCLAPGMVEIITLTAVCALLRSVMLDLERPTQTLDLAMNPLIAPKSVVRVVVKGRRDPSKLVADAASLSESADVVSAIEEDRSKTSIPNLEPEDHDDGAMLVEQGAEADAFFVLLEGTAEVSRAVNGEAPAVIRTLEAGASFGEIGLLKHVPRTATVRAKGPVRVLRVPRTTFMQIVADNDVTAGDLGALFKRRYLQQGLARAMPALDTSKLGSLASEFQLVHFKPGDVIIKQGNVADAFFVIVSGIVDVFKEKDTGRAHLRALEAGAYMGEIGILQAQARTATCEAKTAVDVIRIERKQFIDMLGGGGAVFEDVATVVGRRLMSDLAKVGATVPPPPMKPAPQEPKS